MSHLVHALGHIKINTRDIDGVVRDATEILGLHVTHSDARQTWLSSNGRAAELVLVKSDENATHTIGLEALTVQRSLRSSAPGFAVSSNHPACAP